jgi:hypothetical protein
MGSPFHTGRLLRVSADLHLRTCDEGVLVFDGKTGKTSLLNHQGARMLRILDSEHGVDEVAARVALDMDNDSDLPEFQTLISSLQNSGLIVR